MFFIQKSISNTRELLLSYSHRKSDKRVFTFKNFGNRLFLKVSELNNSIYLRLPNLLDINIYRLQKEK